MGEVFAVWDAYQALEWAMLIQECSAGGLTKAGVLLASPRRVSTTNPGS